MTDHPMFEKIEALQQHLEPPQATDPMPEAGRKVLLAQFIQLLEHEPGSRSGEDPEDVHKMRVAIRHIRSGLRLLDDFYKSKKVKGYSSELRRLMEALGEVRDLDVMMIDLGEFQQKLDTDEAAAIQEVRDLLDQRRSEARAGLIHYLKSKRFRKFIPTFTKFLTTSGYAAITPDEDEVVPYQVRHVLPPMIYEHLAQVRAYDTVLPEADAETLHALRIEFKRLRYCVALFSDVLGAKSAEFIDEIKTMQDFLGRLNDIQVAKAHLIELMDDLEGHQAAAVWLYIDYLESEKPALLETLPDAWKHFNSKSVQRKLSSAIVAL
ncbi:MAG: CHAD domain-containing protein [Anaerolineae bacterium]|nr:CHAD domain-containing protein [Anaerolineae bacterium]